MHQTKQFNMHEIEDSRMQSMKHPDTPQFRSFIEGLVYPAFQEPATEISHRNTMKLIPAQYKVGRTALARVIGDEAKHGKFYRDMTGFALEVDPNMALIGIARQIKSFAMPGKGIPGFNSHKEIISKAGIFGPIQLKAIYDEVLTKEWHIWDIENLDSSGEKARDFIDNYLNKMAKAIEWANRKTPNQNI